MRTAQRHAPDRPSPFAISAATIPTLLAANSRNDDLYGTCAGLSRDGMIAVVGATQQPAYASATSPYQYGQVSVHLYDTGGPSWKRIPAATIDLNAYDTAVYGDYFGISVAIAQPNPGTGTYLIVVGAPGKNTSVGQPANGMGMVYVFALSNINVGSNSADVFLLAKLVAATTGGTAEGAPGDLFGTAVAADGPSANGDYFVVVGAPGRVNATVISPYVYAGNSGAVYAFRGPLSPGTTWPTSNLKPIVKFTDPNNSANGYANDLFGQAVAVRVSTAPDGITRAQTIVVGAPGANASGTTAADNSGAVYVYTYSGSAWSLNTTLSLSDTLALRLGDRFGAAVALSGLSGPSGGPYGYTLVVGTQRTDGGANPPPSGGDNRERAYVLNSQGTTWSTTPAKLDPNATGQPQDHLQYDYYGYSVAISWDGTVIAVGAFNRPYAVPPLTKAPLPTPPTDQPPTMYSPDGGGFPGAGAVYVWVGSGSTWNTSTANELGIAPYSPVPNVTLSYTDPANPTIPNQHLGYSVAVGNTTSGTITVLAGVPYYNGVLPSGSPVGGAVQVFTGTSS